MDSWSGCHPTVTQRKGQASAQGSTQKPAGRELAKNLAKNPACFRSRLCHVKAGYVCRYVGRGMYEGL